MIIFKRQLAAAVTALALAGGLAATAAPTADAAPAAPAARPATLSDIAIGVRPIDDPSAGHSYVDLTFRNISRHTVTLYGYAGVSVVADHNGTQVGRPARWLRNRRPVTVVLKPGQQTVEIVSIADAADYGSGRGHTVRADGFRVYLPGSRAAAFAPYRFLASTRNVTQLQVDPIGARI